jgi:hypothetical protein
MFDLSEFVTPNNEKEYEKFQDLMFIMSEEFGWSQDDFMNCDLPYLWDLLEARNRAFRKREQQSKKRR